MSDSFFDERKVKSNDIVNGLARRDIFDSKGVLLVKKDTRISEAHYARMREEGLIQEDQENSRDKRMNMGLNYVDPNSIHGRLEKLSTSFSKLQKDICEEALPEHKNRVVSITHDLLDLCDKNIFQVIGELYLSEKAKYNFHKPLYIAASLTELIKRFNIYQPGAAIDEDKRNQFIYAALLYNLGLVTHSASVYQDNARLDPQKRNEIRKNYPQASVKLIKQIGFDNPLIIDIVENHNIASQNPSFEALLLRTPFIYAGIAMPEQASPDSHTLSNPCREFAQMFAEKKLDPVLGGLFLKINGLAPVGAILIFDTQEKALIIKGPDETNISSSQIRMLTNRNGVQFNRPGDKLFLHKTTKVNKGLSDHHQFAWGKFPPFNMWQG